MKQTQKTNKTGEEIRLFFIPLHFEHQIKKTIYGKHYKYITYKIYNINTVKILKH